MNLLRGCYHNPTPIVKLENTTYYGGDEGGILSFNGDFVLNLTKKPNITRATNGPSQLTKYIEYPFEELLIPWPDFKLPKVKMQFWKSLYNYIDEKKWKNVCVHCEGGHGRTGTAVAALIIANAGLSAEEAVETIRESYCELAVETIEQCIYLQEVDKYYNKRKINEDACPVPSMFYAKK